MSQLVNLLPIVGLVLIFWLLILRPAQKRQKEMRALQASLTPGDEVLLGSGLIGTLRSLDDDRAQIEVAPGVHVTVVRGSIAARTTATLDGPADTARPEDV
ncbi:Sec translocon accessory complex subunit YajC [Nocardioides aquaticus]|uniref:Sec translocon accessory complex subunit YajC n=1 Tax=Nocardioides aquaticus TaxID=160826 RepID=A0ABX8EP07_9ACTN|nr:preprotein translocase subunit YajC [Nocardioides aquaticus]QVT80388.1 Sec translocon accessory complex subunit YajC [Nocardioides aquaticus]